jgi:hypothetical protein
MKQRAKHIPEIHVDLDAPASERWIGPGRKIAARIHALTDSVLETCGEYLPAPLQPLLTKKASFASLLAQPICQALLGPLMDECRGLSKATGIPAPLLAISNCAYDFCQLLPGFYPTACSAAVFHDASDRPVMLRYMDWAIPEDIAKYTVLVHFESGGHPAYSALGFAGFLGVVTAVGPAWAVALNQAPSARVRKSLFGSPACYSMRLACDESGTFREMRANILSSRTFTPFLSLLCGTEQGEATRIEKPFHGSATSTRPSAKTPAALSNHYLHRDHRKLNSETEWTDEDGEEWMSDTEERFSEVHRLGSEAEGGARLPGLRRFEEEPVFNDSTVHLALMRPATGTLKFKNFIRRGGRA